MYSKLPRLALTLTILFFTGAASGQEIPRRSPHNGDLYQADGYADSYFNWLNVGGWVRKNGSIPGFELDYSVDTGYYSSCTSYTTLPRKYDDCETAGVLEESEDTIVFGVGSYDARQITSGTEYFAQWLLQGGGQTASGYGVGWQEVWDFNDLGYGPDSPWHMDSVAGGKLVTDYLVLRNQPQLRAWKWRDRSLSGTSTWKQEPDNSYYYSPQSRLHTATLKVPSGADFDLYLYWWNGTSWQKVASSLAYSSSPESISYTGSPGYYAWIIYSYSGSGRYQFGFDYFP